MRLGRGWWIGLVAVLLGGAVLAGCGQQPAPPAAAPPAPATDTSSSPTAAPAAAPTLRPTDAPTAVATAGPTATLAAAPSATIGATPAPAGRFVVPAAAVETVTLRPLPGAAGAAPDAARVQQELHAFFESFYQARSLEPGRELDVFSFRGLVGGAYADYTIPLFQRDVRDAKAGILRALRYSNIKVVVEEWQAGEGSAGTARVSVSRTLTADRTDVKQAPQTATYQFRVQRQALGGPESIAWVATDFLNPATGRWVSEPTPARSEQLAAETQAFFEEFYAARSVARGGTVDLFRSSLLTQFSYAAYTLPLLEGQKQEVDAGKILAIGYRDITVKLITYDPAATNHGGTATVEVTRTALVTRLGGEEPPQTGTYRFRLHRHVEGDGAGRWVAVDFFQPEAKHWVSEIAGMAVPVPASGHG